MGVQSARRSRGFATSNHWNSVPGYPLGSFCREERKINNSKQRYIYIKLCGQTGISAVCLISKGLIYIKKDLGREFNPTVREQQQQHQHQQKRQQLQQRKAAIQSR